MIYTKITIETTVEAVDMVSYTLSELGVEGIEIHDKLPLTEEEKQAMYIDILPEETEVYDGLASVSCYIPHGETNFENIYNTGTVLETPPVLNIPELITNIRSALMKLSEFMDVGPMTITVDDSDDKDWLYKWQQYFKPFRLEDTILIKPTWEPLEQTEPDDIVVEIDPGIAFGTGSHETTKLVVKAMKEYVSPGMTMLDLGCGSGILTIIGAKLGIRQGLGVDIDEIAVRVSRENASQNGLSETDFCFVCGNLLEDAAFADSITEKYDILAANILADVIIPMTSFAGRCMNENSIFLSSGIMLNREEEVVQALKESGMDIVNRYALGDWVCLAARKRG